ncbi:hypothetical protein GQ54DRAFT_325070 [Martensiomyces pterosporus]|nr:hypothetical protein GQ54DRAFT_325070 [Martensiomyces pterosporus]
MPPPVLTGDVRPPTDQREVILISVCTALLFKNFLFLLYTFFQRRYLPLKCKNLPLMYWTYFATVAWFIGNVYTNQTIAPKSSWFVCVVTYSWLKMSLGGYLWMSLFQFRVYQFIAIFIWKRRVQGKYLWYPVAYMVAIPLAYAIVAAALPQNIGLKYIPPLELCFGSKAYFYVAMALVFFQILAFIFIIFMARNIHTCFNEYTEILVCFFVALGALIGGIVTFWIPATPHRAFIFGTLNTVLPIATAQVYFYVLLVRPVYHSVFDKEEYLKFFLARMRQYNLIREYQMANNESTSGLGSGKRSALASHGAMPGQVPYDNSRTNSEYYQFEGNL